MDIKILEPIRNYLKEFNSIDEFNNFYSLNKEELDKLTTHKLNKMYHIKGYRITKIKNELMLKKWDEEKKVQEVDDNREDEMKNDILNMKDEIRNVKNDILHMRDEIRNVKNDILNLRDEITDINNDIKKINLNINKIIDFCNNL